MNPIIVLIPLALLLATGNCAWSQPTKLLEIAQQFNVFITSVYTDPSTQISHVTCTDGTTTTYFYMAVNSAGKVMQKREITTELEARNMVIKGAGDGKHLYLAYGAYDEDLNDANNFTESEDGGKTWSNPLQLLVDGKRRMLQDMYYESGRISILYLLSDAEYTKHDLAMVTRPAGSKVFGTEVTITSDTTPDYTSVALFVPTSAQGKSLIHVFFVSNDLLLKYTQSADNGVTWSKGKTVSQANDKVLMVSNVVANSKLTEKVFAIYNVQYYGPAYLIYTADNGATFSAPIAATANQTYYDNQHGAAICGGLSSSSHVLATYFMNDEKVPEYYFWNLKTMKKTERPHPFLAENADSVAIDCAVDPESKQLKVNAFVTLDVKDGAQTDLMYAQESTALKFADSE